MCGYRESGMKGYWYQAAMLGVVLGIWEGNTLIHAALIHRWSFDGNANDSVGGAHATLINGASISGGWLVLANSGTSNDPNTNQYASLPIGSTIASLDNMTIETWILWGGGNNWQRIWDFGTGTTSNMFLTPKSSSTDKRFAITTTGGSGEQRVTDSGALSIGTPVHLVVTLDDATDTARMYLNGVLVAQNTSVTLKPSNLGNTTQNWLGRSQYSWDPFFSGAYDEVRIYNQAFSQHLVNISYQLGPDRLAPTAAYQLAGLMDEAVAVWQFRAATDSNGAESNFTPNGNFTVGNTNNTGAVQALNSDRYAANEGAGNSWGELASLSSDHELVRAAGGSLTMFARVRLEQFNGVDDVWRVGASGSAAQDTYALELYNGRPRFVLTGAGNASETILLHGETLQTNTWYDLTGVFNATAGTMTLYVYSPVTGTMIGQPVTSSVSFSTLATFSSMNLLFLEAPSNFNGTNVGGQLELAILWNRALSPEEVALLSLVVPEPSTSVLVMLGMVGLAAFSLWGRKRLGFPRT
ncbi:MAG: LamG domain-containing protein [Thermoguttaceae bacterium]|nr:LamG domain-containing protein [Thermoguttaceae bacterium]MDW8037791.1 LamG domain-containing protein [Thermoguttaceae bacterium]